MTKYLCLFALILGFANVCDAEGANGVMTSASASADATSAPKKKAPRMHHSRAAKASKPAASKTSL